MSSTYELKHDLKEAEAMANGLNDYVQGDQLYGQTAGGFFSNMPSLTIGALVMRLRRLNALRDQMTDGQRKTLDEIHEQWQVVREEWRVHYEQKIQREISSRIDAMSAFFKECNDSMARCAQVYRPELSRRTIVQELLREVEALNVSGSEFRGAIRTADGNLRGLLTMGEFQWSDILQPIYPQSEFWWLYGKPEASDK